MAASFIERAIRWGDEWDRDGGNLNLNQFKTALDDFVTNIRTDVSIKNEYAAIPFQEKDIDEILLNTPVEANAKARYAQSVLNILKAGFQRSDNQRIFDVRGQLNLLP